MGSQAMTGQRRLETWKEVAAFLRKDVRTAKRWEASRGLPIHRLPGARSRIYAEIAELEAWRAGATPSPATAATPPADSPPDPAPASSLPAAGVNARSIQRPRKAPAPGVLACVGALAAVAVLLMVAAGSLRLHAGDGTVPAHSKALYAAGMRDFATRTPLGLTRAVSEFEAAIAETPTYARPYAGLADSYDLLREYTGMPASQAFSLAQAAARKALSLDPDLGDAHAALAFARYWGFWDSRDARAHFVRAITLDPASSRAHHWYATFLVNQGDTAAALSEIDTALRLDPGSRAVIADRALILHDAGRNAESLGILRRLAASQPDFLSPHAYLADIAFDTGDDGAYLDEALRTAELSGAEEQAAAAREAKGALAAGGRRAMLETLLRSQTRAFINGRASAFSVARLHAALGETSLSRAYLRLAFDRRETDCLTLKVDRVFDSLRGDAVVAELQERLNRA